MNRELADIFRDEASELLQNIENDLVILEEEQDDEVVNRLFRYFHTLKGSSGIAGFESVSVFTHKLENVLDRVRSGDIEVNSDIIDLLLSGSDWVKGEVFDGNTEGLLPDDYNDKLSIYLGENVLIPQKKTKNKRKEGEKYFRIRAKFREDIFEYGVDPLIILEDLYHAGEFVEKKVYRKKLDVKKNFNPQKCYMHWLIVLKTTLSEDEINGIFLFVNDDNDIEVRDVTGEFTDDVDSISEERKVGDILLNKGLLSEEDLEEILNIQKKSNLQLGELLIQKGYVTKKELDEALGLQSKIKKRIAGTTVRVDTHKLDNLLNLLGEIVIGQSSISRLSEAIDENISYSLKNALYGLDRTTRQFQEQIMSIRMVPVGPTFDQFKRFVRDSAQQLGKDIKLIIEGRDTEIDKTVIEKIGDPLKHMIRNSIDHGLETPEERKKIGKNETGVIKLSAYHQEGNVYIEIRDDGRGIDPKKIKSKAIEKGLISENDSLSDDKIINLIFHPGFSTAEKVGEFSGRGVGMDVVKNNIDELRGSVNLSTKTGEGSVFRIKLPLTLAIIEGMLVQVGQSVFIIPLLSILESIRPKKEDVESVKGKGEVVKVRGEYIPLLRSYDYFEIDSDKKNPWEALLVIVESGNDRLALMVDDLIGQQQIVIKSLEGYITKNRAVSGASILGDGSVALIIDIHGLLSEINEMKGKI